MVVKLLTTLLALLLTTSALAVPATDGFAADFVQTRTLPGFDEPIISHGHLSFDQASGFRWEITRPYHYLFQMQDGVARETLPDGSQRTLDAADTPWLKVVQQVFVAGLSGDGEELTRYFNVEITPLENGSRVTMVPRSKAMAEAIRRITVIENAAGQPEELALDEASGGHMTIRFMPASTPAQ